MGTLKVQLNSEDDPDKIAQIKYLIQRIENQNREKKKVEKEKNVLVDRKKKNRELVKEGKSRGLIEKYEELKNSNKLEKYMKKKSKKNLGRKKKKKKKKKKNRGKKKKKKKKKKKS